MQGFLDRLDARGLIAFVLILCVMALAFLLAIRSPESQTFNILLGGIMTVGFASVIQWYYGSSSGSAMKDEALANTAKSQTETIASQSVALAQSVPAPVTTTHVDARAGTAETTTAPVPPVPPPPPPLPGETP
jgi:hypothetical protein